MKTDTWINEDTFRCLATGKAGRLEKKPGGAKRNKEV